MTPSMIPGQEPYTEAELASLYSLVADAAEGDEGELNEGSVIAAVLDRPEPVTLPPLSADERNELLAAIELDLL